MPTKSNAVKTVQIVYVCDNCHEGEMVHSGRSEGNAYRVAHHHYCDKCNYNQDLDVVYPYIDYEPLAATAE
jgi:hypothetical protein